MAGPVRDYATALTKVGWTKSRGECAARDGGNDTPPLAWEPGHSGSPWCAIARAGQVLRMVAKVGVCLGPGIHGDRIRGLGAGFHRPIAGAAVLVAGVFAASLGARVDSVVEAAFAVADEAPMAEGMGGEGIAILAGAVDRSAGSSIPGASWILADRAAS